MSDGSLGKCNVCGSNAGTLYPLLPGSPAFCGAHHNPRDAGPFSCDFSNHWDDFDAQDLRDDEPLFDRATFIWTDIDGDKHPLNTIDDEYLRNIIGHLERKLVRVGPKSRLAEVRLELLIEFLEEEQMLREVEKK